ncbi:lysophospholipid acyltransferase family protein [Knoellia sp. CPCC 206453]|uniref:lysophospholipid acyltransferase family protein n=1 Tax=Knoellia pratensis TaxID=3404796 RepID=UPI00361F0110
MNWRQPGRRDALLYGVAAAVAGGLVASVARLEGARQVGRRSVAQQLPGGPLIVIANHTSYADGILLAIACRDLGRSLRLLATAGVFRAPLLGPVVRRLGFIPVHRGSDAAARSLDAAAEALAAGEAVGLFPEGRITRDPGHWPERSKTGAVRLALRTGAPVVPVALQGAQDVVGRSRNLRRTLRNLALPPEVSVLVGETIDVVALAGADPDEATVRRVADEVMGRLIDLIEELRGLDAAHEYGVPRDPADG